MAVWLGASDLVALVAGANTEDLVRQVLGNEGALSQTPCLRDGDGRLVYFFRSPPDGLPVRDRLVLAPGLEFHQGDVLHAVPAGRVEENRPRPAWLLPPWERAPVGPPPGLLEAARRVEEG